MYDDIFNDFSLTNRHRPIIRCSSIDTEEYENGQISTEKPEVKTKPMGFSDKLKSTPAGMMKKELEESIEKGYENLSRGLKIRVLKELLEKYKEEGEQERKKIIGVRRLAANNSGDELTLKKTFEKNKYDSEPKTRYEYYFGDKLVALQDEEDFHIYETKLLCELLGIEDCDDYDVSLALDEKFGKFIPEGKNLRYGIDGNILADLLGCEIDRIQETLLDRYGVRAYERWV